MVKKHNRPPKNNRHEKNGDGSGFHTATPAPPPQLPEQKVNITSVIMSEGVLYDYLIPLTLKADELFKNGYPELNEHNEVRIFKHFFPFRGPNTRKKWDCDADQNWNSTVGVQRNCVRCNTAFFITENEYLTKERCIHHWGKLVKYTYSCCGRKGRAAGCSSSKYHVWTGIVTGVNERLEGFVKTKKTKYCNRKRKIYAIDCEMCYTVKGLELGRVTILGFNGTVVYEHFVKPENEVVDYATRFSGLTESDVNSEKAKTFAEVQKDLLDLIGEETILLGHSLDTDMRVLKLLHSRFVDTALIFPHVRGHPFKCSLKHLMLTHLNKEIQNSDTGHDSYEDALSCLELIFLKVRAIYGIPISSTFPSRNSVLRMDYSCYIVCHGSELLRRPLLLLYGLPPYSQKIY